MKSSSVPRLSVFTIGYESASLCRAVIENLKRQTIRSEIEIVLVAPDREGLEDRLFEDFWDWQWIRLPDETSFGKVMEAVVRAAHAPFVTYAEEHSFFHEAWAERLIAAHQQGYDVVGFAIENANPETLVSWAHLYGQFGPVIAPVDSGETDFLGGHHVSYRRAFLLDYESRLSDFLEDESALFLDLRTEGKPLFLAGDAISQHINISRLNGYMHLDYLGQRSFASARSKLGNWPWWKRAAYAGAGPLIPFVRLGRILTDIRRTKAEEKLMPKILVPIFLALLAGAWGEMLGYLFGGGDSARKKAPIEFQREKFLSKKDKVASFPRSA